MTAGLKWAPDTAPNSPDQGDQGARWWRPRWRGAGPPVSSVSRLAMIPEPIDGDDEECGSDALATSRAKASASGRNGRRELAGADLLRHEVGRARRGPSAPCSATHRSVSSSGRCRRPSPCRRRSRSRRRCRSPSSGRRRARCRTPRRCRDREPTSCPARRSSTTRSLGSSDRSPSCGGSGDRRSDLVGRVDLDADVVERARLTGVGEQDQLERRIGDREVGVAVTDLRRRGLEQLGVERDRLRRGRRR